MVFGRRKAQCRRIHCMLPEFLDDRLGHDDRDMVKSHLETCETCTRELESLQMAVAMLHRVPIVPAPRSFAIRNVATERVSIFDPQRLRWLRPATAVVTVLLLVVLAIDFLQVLPLGMESADGGVATEEPRFVPVPTSEQGEQMFQFSEPAESPPVGTSVTVEKCVAESHYFEEDDTMRDTGSAWALDAPTSGWPLRQIEIALAVVVFSMVAVLAFTRRRRRSWSK